ncbi:hypothetical protein OK17_21075 [Gordonia sp. GN26]
MRGRRLFRFINKNGEFFWTDVIEFRRPGVHNDGGLNDIGRIERPFSREIKPPRNTEKRERSKAVFWSDRSDGSDYFRWTGTENRHRDDDALSEERRAPAIVPSRLESIEDYVARAVARTIALQRIAQSRSASSRRGSRL